MSWKLGWHQLLWKGEKKKSLLYYCVSLPWETASHLWETEIFLISFMTGGWRKVIRYYRFESTWLRASSQGVFSSFKRPPFFETMKFEILRTLTTRWSWFHSSKLEIKVTGVMGGGTSIALSKGVPFHRFQCCCQKCNSSFRWVSWTSLRLECQNFSFKFLFSKFFLELLIGFRKWHPFQYLLSRRH